MPRPDPWILAAAAAASAVLAVIVGFHVTIALREWRLRRDALGTLAEEGGTGLGGPTPAAVVQASADLEEGFLGFLGERIPRLWDLHHLLVQSGLGWSLGDFVIRVGATATVTGAVTLLVADSVGLSVLLALTAGLVPYAYVRWQKKRRLARLESQLPGTIDLIARAVRAGHPLSAGLRMASEEVAEPLASELRVTFEEQRFGLPFEEALLGLGDRVEIVDVRILITAILVQREVGGNLSEILETIAETMRARFSLRRQVRVYTAQGRMSGYTLAALPVLVGLLISVLNPGYMQPLFQEALGKALLGGAAVLQVLGFLWIRRIVDVRY